jgi:hypothetical protein
MYRLLLPEGLAGDDCPHQRWFAHQEALCRKVPSHFVHVRQSVGTKYVALLDTNSTNCATPIFVVQVVCSCSDELQN